MKYTEGDTVKFKLKSGELLEGDVLFIERSHREDVLYINSSNRWAYRVPEKRIISRVPKKNKSVQPNHDNEEKSVIPMHRKLLPFPDGRRDSAAPYGR